MFFIQEKYIEAELQVEVRDLPDENGKMVPVRGYRFMWRDFDEVINKTDIDPLFILEVARTYADEHGDPWGCALSETIAYFRETYVLGKA
ncbi:MAG: hypothetical protein QNJ13_13315 [Paracoccaceae bacterium]|nr:hypothetical protein [Paracoccaceae bacterium]